MKFRVLIGIFLALEFLTSCGSTNKSSSTSSTGLLYVATQGDSKVSPYAIDLTTGNLTSFNKPVSAGGTPVAMVLAPSGSTLFVVTTGSGGSGSVSMMAVNSDGTLGAAGNTQSVGLNPKGVAIDSAGHFLFVVNQGSFSDPTSGTISVFTIQSSALTPVGTAVNVSVGAASNRGPAAIAVTADGKFVYTANSFDSTISKFKARS